MLKRPRRLGPGSVVAVVAPAGPVDEARLEQGLAVLRQRGYEVREGRHLRARDAYLAGDDDARAADLREALADSDVAAIWCARGGYGSMRVLERFDPRPWAAGKLLLGYSDITALLCAFAQGGGAACHAPMVLDLAPERDFGPLWDLLERPRAPMSYRWPAGRAPRCLRPGRAEGRIVGGNLSLLASLAGTAFFPDLHGALLLLEDVNEPLYRLDRMLTQLRLSGRLEGVAGVMVGETRRPPERADAERAAFDADVDRLFLERLGDLSIPILAGLPFSHQPPRWPLPWVRARMDAEAGELVLLELLVE